MQIFDRCDAFGPSKVIHVHEPSIGLQGIAVIDNVALGPAIGGMRMAPDVTFDECARLARAMTLKNSAAGLRHGGGKSVLIGDPRMPDARKEQWVRCFAAALREVAEYIIGPDMGTDERCMAWAWDECGRAVGLPRALGGIPLDEIGATAWGMLHAARAVEAELGIPIAGARIVTQGFGAVGLHAARYFTQHGAILVAAADSHGGTYSRDGLDVAALITHKRGGARMQDFAGGSAITHDALIGIECDMWMPAARPDVIDASNVERLKTRVVIEGANIPVTPEAEAALHARGVWCIPDFIANAGGVICAASEWRGATESAAMANVADKVRQNTEAVLRHARSSAITPRQAAIELAWSRVREAMALRRWSTFSSAPGFV